MKPRIYIDKKVKEFDCLEFKYKAQERIYNEIKNLSYQEEITYFI